MKRLILLLACSILPQLLAGAAHPSGTSGHELSFAEIREQARLGQLGDLLNNGKDRVDDEDLEQALMGAMEGNQVDAVDKLIKHLEEKKNNREKQNFMNRFIASACGADKSEVIRYIYDRHIYQLDDRKVFRLGGKKIADAFLELNNFPIPTVLCLASTGDNVDVVKHLATRGALGNSFERYIALRSCFDHDKLLSPRVFEYLMSLAKQIGLHDLMYILMIGDEEGELNELQNHLIWNAFEEQGWLVYNFIHLAQDFDYDEWFMEPVRTNFDEVDEQRAIDKLDRFVRDNLETLLPLKNGQSIKEACSFLAADEDPNISALYESLSDEMSDKQAFNFLRELWREPHEAYQMLKDLQRDLKGE